MCKAFLNDAELYKKQQKERFEDVRQHFRNVMNTVRTEQYENFVRLNQEKGKDLLDKIKEKTIKNEAYERLETLKNKVMDAGKKISLMTGFDESEEEDADSDLEVMGKTKFEDNEAFLLHKPKIGGTPSLKKNTAGATMGISGIPRPPNQPKKKGNDYELDAMMALE